MHQEIRDGLSATIGNTPLIRLRRASDATGCEILGKAEFLNPGGSVKDRAARGILDDAERRGLIAPGGTFVAVMTTSAPYALRSKIFSCDILSAITKMQR